MLGVGDLLSLVVIILILIMIGLAIKYILGAKK